MGWKGSQTLKKPHRFDYALARAPSFAGTTGRGSWNGLLATESECASFPWRAGWMNSSIRTPAAAWGPSPPPAQSDKSRSAVALVGEEAWIVHRREGAIGAAAREGDLVLAGRLDSTTSKRSRFITLFHAATKSWTNFSCASELP